MRILLFLAFAVLVPEAGIAQDAGATNALWNDSGAKGELGFSIYPTTGGCPDLRTKGTSILTFSPKTKGDEHAVAGLQFCFLLTEARAFVHCRSGSVRYARDARDPQRITGNYSFLMADGSKREGSF